MRFFLKKGFFSTCKQKSFSVLCFQITWPDDILLLLFLLLLLCKEVLVLNYSHAIPSKPRKTLYIKIKDENASIKSTRAKRERTTSRSDPKKKQKQNNQPK
jgi:hypothetical protein